MIIIILPIFIVFTLLALYLYYKCLVKYMISAREVKRLEGILLTPVISNFQEIINGITVIRAFDRNEYYSLKYINAQHAYIVSQINKYNC